MKKNLIDELLCKPDYEKNNQTFVITKLKFIRIKQLMITYNEKHKKYLNTIFKNNITLILHKQNIKFCKITIIITKNNVKTLNSFFNFKSNKNFVSTALKNF